jgi:PHP family Zn ribbon phosphoesterase
MEENFTDKGQYFMVRCYKCHRENYLPAAASGQCVWCGEQGSADKELDHKISLLIKPIDEQETRPQQVCPSEIQRGPWHHPLSPVQGDALPTADPGAVAAD